MSGCIVTSVLWNWYWMCIQQISCNNTEVPKNVWSTDLRNVTAPENEDPIEFKKEQIDSLGFLFDDDAATRQQKTNVCKYFKKMFLFQIMKLLGFERNNY